MIRIITLLCVWCPLQLEAQNPVIELDKFGLTKGLITKKLYNVTSDKHGFIWMSSENGVFRFDGKTFKNYTSKDGLCDNEILKVFIDSKNRIWCSGYNGQLSLIENGTVKPVPDFNKINSSFIFNFQESPDGQIYLLGDKSVLFKLDSNYNVTQLPTLKHNSIERLVFTKSAKYLTANYAPYLFKLNNKDVIEPDLAFVSKIKRVKSYYFFKHSSDWWFLINDTSLCTVKEMIPVKHLDMDFELVRNIKLVHNRYLLFTLFTAKTLLLDKMNQHLTEISELNSEVIQDIHEDAIGNIWLTGISGALYRLQIQMPSQSFDGLLSKGNFMSTFFFDKYIAGIDFDNNLHVFTPRTQTKLKVDSSSTLRLNIFYSAFQKTDDGLFLNTQGGLFKINYNRLDRKLKDAIKHFIIHDKVVYYINSNGFFRYSLTDTSENPKPIQKGRFYNLYADKKKIWLAGKKGLSIMPFSDTVVTPLPYKVPDNGRIETIQGWQNDTLAIGTSNCGIILF